jgi:hypothetical protein
MRSTAATGATSDENDNGTTLRPSQGPALPSRASPARATVHREHNDSCRAGAPLRVDGPLRKKKTRRERGGQGG